MTYEIRFGTDGWRGRIADDYTYDNVRRCTQGFARYLIDNGKRDTSVIVGYDRRFASEHFASKAAEVMAANGFKVWLTNGATPTPVISFSVVHQQAVAAINITASHNPADDSGFKVRGHDGGAIDPAGLLEIEARIPHAHEVERFNLTTGLANGSIQIFDPAPAYIEHLHTLVDFERLRSFPLKVLVDPMWGNGAGWFQRLLSGGRIELVEIHSQRNPIFPEMTRPEPIRPNVDPALAATLKHHADICIMTDGDADRVGIGDENGQFINQLQVFGLLAYYLLEVRGLRGPLVKTLSTTSMIDKLGEIYGLPVHETGIGFKFVAPKMTETDALIGGEESGGFAFRGHVPERDALLAGLYVLDFMGSTGSRSSELLDILFAKLGPHYYDRRDFTLRPEHRLSLLSALAERPPRSLVGLPIVKTVDYDGYKFTLADGSWLLVRLSGTEALVRVYAEARSREMVTDLLREGERLIRIVEEELG